MKNESLNLRVNKFIAVISLGLVIAVFQSCFLVKLPVKKRQVFVKDTVNVYHFIVSGNKSRLADTLTVKSYKNQSKKAYDWLNKRAKENNQTVFFKEHWQKNKDSTLNNTFIFKLPTTNVSILSLNYQGFSFWAKRRTKNKIKRQEILKWQDRLLLTMANSIKDTMLSNRMKKSVKDSVLAKQRQNLYVVHLLKVKKKAVLGFYLPDKNMVVLGYNKSGTIAHESTHHLGAVDLYIHKFWFGKRRRLVRKTLADDIMNNTDSNDDNVNLKEMSNYTKYYIGWDKELEGRFKPLRRYNLMAAIDMFILSLLF